MKAPYYKVYIEGEDITEFVETITYEDTTEEDNIIKLKVYQKYAFQLADDDKFITGKIVSMQFGFIGSTVSELHKARITNITHKYAQRITMNITCLDLGTQIKKTTSKKIWKSITTSQVANELAIKWGLEAEVTDTTKVWDSIPQGNKSDLDFLRYLVDREGNGNFITYLRNQTLYMLERSVKDASKITYTYGYGDGVMVSFTPKLKESSATGDVNQTAVLDIDDKTGTVTASVVDNTTEASTGTTGKYKIQYDANTGKELGRINDSTTDIGKANSSPVADADEATSLANSTKKKASLNLMTAILVIEGNPLLTPNSIITINNVAKRHLGNWLITKVKHVVNSGAYLTTCEMNSNGVKSKKLSNTKADDSNTTEGGDRVDDKVKLRVYSGEDGKFVGYSTTSNTVKKGSNGK